MDQDLRAKILQQLNENRIMSVATLRPDGWPQSTTVGYASEGLRLYFLCARDSQKARNLAWDDRVSLTIDHDVSNPLAIRGLSMAGRAAPVVDPAELRRVAERLAKKFPGNAGASAQETSAQDLSSMAAYEVTPKVVSVLDYTLGFGHADLVEIGEGDL